MEANWSLSVPSPCGGLVSQVASVVGCMGACDFELDFDENSHFQYPYHINKYYNHHPIKKVKLNHVTGNVQRVEEPQ